jgi:uncharacterized protein (TIGR02611 family)
LLRRHARKVGVFVAGWIIVIVGLVLVPLPGPGWVVVFVGLSLLATEFAWASRLKDLVQEWLARWVQKIQAWRAARRRRRLGIIDAVVDDVLEEVEIVAAPRGRRRKTADKRSTLL